METATGIYSFSIGENEVIDIGLLEVNANDKDNSINIETKAIRVEDIVGGLWKSCLLEDGRFIACAEYLFKDLEAIQNFKSIVRSECDVVRSPEEAKIISSKLIEMKKSYDISNEILHSLRMSEIKTGVSSPIVDLEVLSQEKSSLSAEKLEKIESILSGDEFAPRMSEIRKGSILYNIEWDKSDLFALVNDFNSVCGIVIQEVLDEQPNIINDY